MPQIIQNWAPDNKTIVEGHYDRKIATFFLKELYVFKFFLLQQEAIDSP